MVDIFFHFFFSQPFRKWFVLFHQKRTWHLDPDSQKMRFNKYMGPENPWSTTTARRKDFWPTTRLLETKFFETTSSSNHCPPRKWDPENPWSTRQPENQSRRDNHKLIVSVQICPDQQPEPKVSDQSELDLLKTKFPSAIRRPMNHPMNSQK